MVQSRYHTNFVPPRRLLLEQRHHTTDCSVSGPLRQTARRDLRPAARELRWRRRLVERRGTPVRIDRWLRTLPGRRSAAREGAAHAPGPAGPADLRPRLRL